MSLEMVLADELLPALRLPTSQVMWLLPVVLQFAMVREPIATVRTLELPFADGPLMIVLNTVQYRLHVPSSQMYGAQYFLP